MTTAVAQHIIESDGSSRSSVCWEPKFLSKVGGGAGGGGGGSSRGKTLLRNWKNCASFSSTSWAASIIPTPPDSPPPASACHKGLVTAATTKLGLRNLLKVPTSNATNYFLTRQCSYIFYCSRIRVPCHYPKLTNKSLVEDERVKEALEKVVTEDIRDADTDTGEDAVPVSSNHRYKSLVAKYKREAEVTLNQMKAALSSALIRLTGYVLFKVFNFLFMSVTVTEGQLEMIERASDRQVPLIFVPLHRSHVDYLFVTWVLFNREVPAPIVAAGDNLRMPIFGWLLGGLGGFFIKRRLEATKTRKDFLYRALLQTYMSHALHAGYNLEFFIEGGRTRTGKPCLPKGGLLSVIVDSFLSGTLADALIVPIAINYDKILDGNFVTEQLGQKKVPESFWRAVRAIAKVLSTSYGHSRIDFGQPFSLKEFFHASKVNFSDRTTTTATTATTTTEDPSHHHPLTPPSELTTTSEHTTTATPASHNVGHHRSLSTPTPTSLSSASPTPLSAPAMSGHLYATRSNSSLFGSEVTDEYRRFVKALAAHIVHDAEKCQAIMATNAVSFLLSFAHRQGTSLRRLADSVRLLQEDLRSRGRDTGFKGGEDPLHDTIHAITMLGSSLVSVEGGGSGALWERDPTSVVVVPVTSLPSVIELNYYASALLPVFAVDAVVATSLVTMADCDLWSYKDVNTDCIIRRSKLVERSEKLCSLLRNEFLFVRPCGSLERKIQDAIDGLTVSGLLVAPSVEEGHQFQRNYVLNDDSDSSDSSTDSSSDTFYLLSPTSSNLERVAPLMRGLSPLVESYYATTSHLLSLVGQAPTVDTDFVRDVQGSVTTLLQKGVLTYEESIAAEPIRNAVKRLEEDGVVETWLEGGVKVMFLSRRFETEGRLLALQEEVDSFRI